MNVTMKVITEFASSALRFDPNALLGQLSAYPTRARGDPIEWGAELPRARPAPREDLVPARRPARVLPQVLLHGLAVAGPSGDVLGGRVPRTRADLGRVRPPYK